MNRLISGAVAAVLIFSSASYAATTSTDTVTSATAETTTVTTAPKATTTVAPKATTTAPKATTTTAPKTTTAAPKATTMAPKATATAPKAATPAKTTTAPVKAAAAPAVQTKTYEDGTYRGIFLDTNELQVNVDFQLKDNKVTSIKYRWLAYKGKDYKNEKEDPKLMELTKQYTTLITHLVEKDIRTAVKELYKPGDIVKDSTVDGMTGATLKSGKVISAINDALNRGVYSYPK